MSAEIKTLGEIAFNPPSDVDATAWNGLVDFIEENFPDDWRSWEISNYSFTDLFGEEISTSVEAKLRFAIPNEHLAKAFEIPTLSERSYRQIRRKLCTWDLGRALIYAPHKIMQMIHDRCYTKFMDVVSKLRSQITPIRTKTKCSNEKDKSSSHTTESPISQPRHSRKRSLSPVHTSEHDKRRNTSHIEQGSSDHLLAAVLQQQMEMFNKLIQVSVDTNQNIKTLGEHMTQNKADLQNIQATDDEAFNASFDSLPDSTDDVEVEPEQNSRISQIGNRQDGSTSVNRERDLSAKIAEMQQQLDILKQSQENDETESNYENYDFEPNTVEKEGKLSKADPLLLKQGIECQRFRTQSWGNIRYSEVQKQFQASPAFCSLKTNNILANVTPNWSSIAILEKFDHTLGAITNGLLQQRKIFKEVCDKLPNSIRQKVGYDFLAMDSKFRKSSDDLLQYVCGRRSEVLKMRRSTYKPKNKVLAGLLQDIPPTEYHLFDDEKLSEAIKQQGGTQKFFPVKYKKMGGGEKKKREKRGLSPYLSEHKCEQKATSHRN